MFNIKATPSQLALWHAVTALVLSTGTSSGMAIFQYVSSHPVNVGQDVSYGLMILLSAAVLLPVSIYHLVQSSPALPQATADTQAQAQVVGEHLLSQLGPWFQSHFSNVTSTLKSMETSLANHAHVSVPTTPAPSSVPQLAFPPALVVPNTASSATATTTVPPSVMLNTFPMMPAVPKQ